MFVFFPLSFLYFSDSFSAIFSPVFHSSFMSFSLYYLFLPLCFSPSSSCTISSIPLIFFFFTCFFPFIIISLFIALYSSLFFPLFFCVSFSFLFIPPYTCSFFPSQLPPMLVYSLSLPMLLFLPTNLSGTNFEQLSSTTTVLNIRVRASAVGRPVLTPCGVSIFLTHLIFTAPPNTSTTLAH